MSATPTTQQIDPVATQAQLIDLEHPELNLTDNQLIGLAKLQGLYRFQTAGAGTSFPIPAYIKTPEEYEKFEQLITDVFQRKVEYGFQGCNCVLRLTE